MKATSDEESDEMSDHSMERLIDNLNGLNEEIEKYIDEIEHMGVLEEKLDEINNEYMNYYRENADLQLTTRKNYGSGLKWL